MGRRTWQLGMLALILALAGCANDDDEAKVRQNLELWKAKGPSSYVYVIKTNCFCGNTDPVRVVVEDGAVKSAVSSSVDEPEGQTMTELIESLIEKAKTYDEFSADFDPKLGYLLHMSGVRNSNATDNGLDIDVSCFAEGTTDDLCVLPK